MTTKHDVIAAHHDHPEWNSTDIAGHLGCCSAYVRATARRNGLTLPKRSAGGRAPSAASLYLAAQAISRGLTVSELRNSLIRAIAESRLVDAVLDDRGAA